MTEEQRIVAGTSRSERDLWAALFGEPCPYFGPPVEVEPTRRRAAAVVPDAGVLVPAPPAALPRLAPAPVAEAAAERVPPEPGQWDRPVWDEYGRFYPTVRKAARYARVLPATMRRNLDTGRDVNGRRFYSTRPAAAAATQVEARRAARAACA